MAELIERGVSWVTEKLETKIAALRNGRCKLTIKALHVAMATHPPYLGGTE